MKEIRTTPDGKKYWHAWDVGEYRVTLTVPWSPTIGRWSVTTPDGRVLPTPVDGQDNKWFVAGTRVPSLKAAIEAIVAMDADPVPAPTGADKVAAKARSAAARAETAGQVQAEAKSTTGRRPRSRRSTSPVDAAAELKHAGD